MRNDDHAFSASTRPPQIRCQEGEITRSARKPLLVFLTQSAGYAESAIAMGLLQHCNGHDYSFLWRDHVNFEVANLPAAPIGLVTSVQVPAMKGILRAVGGGMPMVSAHECTLDLPIPTITSDAIAITEMVADHLIGEGFENFIFVGCKSSPAARWRADSLHGALAKRLGHFNYQFFDVPSDTEFWGGHAGRGGALARLLRRSPLPTAIVAMNDQTALSCVECVHAAGLSIPQQVAVVGADNHPLYTEMYPLTTVRICYRSIGRTAAAMIDTLRNQPAARMPLERKFVSGELVVRRSSQLRLVGEPRIDRAITYIHDRFSEEITVSQLARIAGMCRASFAMQFLSTVGQPPIKHLIQYRLARAKVLLTRTRMTISEVSAAVGFQSQGYFGRAFRTSFGVTPKSFREQRALADPLPSAAVAVELPASRMPDVQSISHRTLASSSAA